MSPVEDVPNWNAILWALYELGGKDDYVDIEDIYLRCFELAPQRFAWRTRPDLPDFKKCSKALQEAEVRRPKLLVKTGDSFGRQLSVYGQKWIDANSKRLHDKLRESRVVREPRRRPRSRMLSEAENADAFLQWQENRVVPAEKWKVAELLRCSPDSNLAIWRNRLETLRAAAYSADRKDLLEFLKAVFIAHTDWFGGEIRDEI